MKVNKEKITREFCRGKMLLFFPENQAQAHFIQTRLFEMGFRWCRDHGTKVGFEDECVSKGMVLESDGTLWAKPLSDSFQGGILCTYAQLDKNYVPEPDAAMLLEKFNALARQMDRIEALLKPQVLDKPRLPRSGP